LKLNGLQGVIRRNKSVQQPMTQTNQFHVNKSQASSMTQANIVSFQILTYQTFIAISLSHWTLHNIVN
jgi:hypothetical protein